MVFAARRLFYMLFAVLQRLDGWKHCFLQCFRGAADFLYAICTRSAARRIFYMLFAVLPRGVLPHVIWLMGYDIWHMACGMWHMACDMWHVAYGMWHVAYGKWHVAYGMRHRVCGGM